MVVSYIGSWTLNLYLEVKVGLALMNSPSEGSHAAQMACLEEAFAVFEYSEEHLLDGSFLLDVHSS